LFFVLLFVLIWFRRSQVPTVHMYLMNLPRSKDRLERNLEISLNTRFRDVPSPTIFKELMYHKSKQTTFASTECLLLEHGNEPHDSKVQEMNKRLYDIREDYLKNTSPSLFGNYSVLLELKRKWNNVLMEYGDEPIGIKTVANIVLG